jgi:DNA repair exonuclease SbcCD ATPase subunit
MRKAGQKHREANMTRLLNVETAITLETEECCACGVMFAMPANLRQKLQREGGTFYCPNGHGQHYTESEVQALKKKLRVAEDRSCNLEQQLNGALEKLAENQKEIRRARRRANAGLCPYCRRHFTNVERHIHSMHSEEIGTKN